MYARENKVSSLPVCAQLFQIGDRFRAIPREIIPDAVLFEKMPAFAMRVVKDGWVTAIGRDDSRIRRCRFSDADGDSGQILGSRTVIRPACSRL